MSSTYNTGSGFNEARSRFDDDVHRVVSDTESLLDATGEAGNEQMAKLKSKTKQSVESLRAAVASAPEKIRSQIHDQTATAEQMVRDRPLQAMGVAAGIGLLIGLLAVLRSR